jgi:glycosyltransferase involved in cell wall biosynthesis
VASNATSLPEIAGDAALLVDPLNPEAMAAVLRQALLDSDLRKDLSQRGVLRARKFTWENSARQVLDIYTALLEQ